ncbi:MAG: PQQ-dependent sugar dehydrogenase [Planctomycetota bacterium]
MPHLVRRRLPLVLFALLALPVLLLACGGGGGGTTPPSFGPPFGLTQRVTLATLGFPDGLPQPGPVDLVRAYPSLSFSRPVYVGVAPAPDGTSWMIVLEQDGRVLAFRNDDATSSVSTVLDLRSVAGGPVSRSHNEEGLLGIAFDPEFAVAASPHAGQFYVHYSAAGPRRGVVARYTATFAGAGAPPVASTASASIVLELGQPYGNHNGGTLLFGPDDYLYLAFGDGGSGDDPQRNGQDRSTLLGSMLRIDPRNPPSGQPYGVPADNPWVGVAGVRPETWAYGLRNPWRWSFDRATGALWLGDVGQGQREEIDLVTRGSNQGWRLYEGSLSYLDPGTVPAVPVTPPVRDYGRNLGTTVIGGHVYRGDDVPTLRGSYVHGDYGSGRIWALVHDGIQVVQVQQVASLSGLVSFGEDERGELYAVSLNGTLHRFREPSGGTPPPPYPATLSATGLFTNLATLTPAAGLVPYEVNSPLWSDGARKRRWIGLPGSTQIAFDPSGPWSFPQGTVLVKHFEIDLVPGDVGSAKRLETRVLRLGSQGWEGTTYRWRSDGSDADLIDERETETFDVEDLDAPGGTREQTWTYPSRSDCFQCHTQAAGIVLGVRTGQLHREVAYPAATDDQLRAWNHIGLFTTDIGDVTAYAAWAEPDDLGAALEARVRAYFASNCAMCHLPGGPAPGNVDLRHDVPLAGTGIVDERPQQGDLGLMDPWIVHAGDPASSVLLLRMRRRDTLGMPRLGTALVDEVASDLVEAWIQTLP